MPDTDTNEVSTTLNAIAQGLSYGSRSPVLRSPGDEGLAWEDITFPSADGVPLEGWFIPRAGSDKLVIFAHPFGFSRAGFPSHIEPWKSAFGPGNDFEISFVPEYKILHDHGYNVLAYDFRNFGLSSSANGGLQSNNRFEARDVLGSLAYARARSDLKDMKIGLFSRCMGGNATFRAAAGNPGALSDVRCLVAPLLLSAHVALEQMLAGAGLPEHVGEVDRRIQQIIGVSLRAESPVDWARSVTVPTLTYGVREDAITRSSDLEGIFEAIGTQEKSMFWIETSTRRWDGYTWFQRHPKRILAWFEKYMV